MPSTRKLSPLQERFCREYLIDHNATRAAARAGYSPRTANEQGSQLLARLSIQQRIAELTGEQQQRLEIEADDVLRGLLEIARSDLGDILDFSGTDPKLKPACQIPSHARRCLAGIKVRRYTEGRGDNALEVEVIEFKLWDKVAALDKLARHKGLLKDILEHQGEVRMRIVEEIVDGDDHQENPPAPNAAGVPAE